MNRVVRRLYGLLPGRFRSVAASLRGYYLRRWRYGAETERLVEEALERESWTGQQWQSRQEERLAELLYRAATHVPYYQEQWQERRRKGDRACWEQLENWPILEKEPLRRNPRRFLSDDCRPRKLFKLHTSGTTGTPVCVWQSKDTLRAWYALFEARWRCWYGVSRRDRWAIVGGQMVVPFAERQPPFWVWNAALRQLYLSAHHLSPDLIPHYLRALRKYRVRYLLGYTSALHTIAMESLRLGQSDLQLKVVLANAEPLLDHQRQTIAAAFNCPVRETYGLTEKICGASECEAGHLHLWPEAGVIEVLDHGQAVPPGSMGEFVITGLLNADMPLVRYRVGDSGVLASSQAACPCGRSLPILQSVEGRTDDLLYTSDGRCIGRLDPVFKADMAIREAQIVQETLQRVRVRYVPARGYRPAHGNTIVESLQARMGQVEVVLEQVSQIPRTANGKFRAVVCELSRPPSPTGRTPVSQTEPQPRRQARTLERR